MKKLYAFTALLMFPVAAWSASPRLNGSVSTRGPNNSAPGSLLSSVYSDLYSDVPTLVRALVTPRSVPTIGTRGSPRLKSDSNYSENDDYTQTSDQPIKTKAQYISFLEDSTIGTKTDCADRYTKYVNFFSHDSTLSGQISYQKGAISTGRLDITCDFLSYAHWCFALGFAYAIRDFDDPVRINDGSKCLTYEEFCQNGKNPDTYRVEEYLSRIIDEIMFYNKNIKNTNKNIVNTMIKTDGGTTNGWKGYDTDKWVQERIPKSEMIRILCK